MFEHNDGVEHKDYENRNTRVSEYLRKYGQGKIDSLPTDSRPEIHDARSDDEKIDAPTDVTNQMASEQLDILLEMQSKAEDFEKAFADIQLTAKQAEKYKSALKVLKDKNASYEQTLDAYRILDELKESHKVTRARD